mmetsp:Transcript_2420/g.8894  ORF Transcript_2420/g.8894 Transcript_2420/m.8894 type:complete len:331 (-) Transcript_2420:1385-2377(-)
MSQHRALVRRRPGRPRLVPLHGFEEGGGPQLAPHRAPQIARARRQRRNLNLVLSRQTSGPERLPAWKSEEELPRAEATDDDANCKHHRHHLPRRTVVAAQLVRGLLERRRLHRGLQKLLLLRELLRALGARRRIAEGFRRFAGALRSRGLLAFDHRSQALLHSRGCVREVLLRLLLEPHWLANHRKTSVRVASELENPHVHRHLRFAPEIGREVSDEPLPALRGAVVRVRARTALERLPRRPPVEQPSKSLAHNAHRARLVQTRDEKDVVVKSVGVVLAVAVDVILRVVRQERDQGCKAVQCVEVGGGVFKDCGPMRQRFDVAPLTLFPE